LRTKADRKDRNSTTESQKKEKVRSGGEVRRLHKGNRGLRRKSKIQPTRIPGWETFAKQKKSREENPQIGVWIIRRLGEEKVANTRRVAKSEWKNSAGCKPNKIAGGGYEEEKGAGTDNGQRRQGW